VASRAALEFDTPFRMFVEVDDHERSHADRREPAGEKADYRAVRNVKQLSEIVPRESADESRQADAEPHLERDLGPRRCKK